MYAVSSMQNAGILKNPSKEVNKPKFNQLQSFGLSNNEKTPAKQDEANFNISYVQNSKNDIFLKDYLINKVAKKGISPPSSIGLNVYAPDIEKTPNQGFREIVFGPYDSYVDDFFTLMNQDKTTFDQRVKSFKCDKKTTEKISGLYDYLDNYYKLELTLKNSKKPYNLLKLSEKDKKELLNEATAEEKPFVTEALANAAELKTLAFKFSRSEVERKTLSIAGEGSRDFIIALVLGMFGLFGLDKLKPGIINALGGETTTLGKKFGIVTEFVGGVGDDVLASGKDYYQDKVTMGKPVALGVLLSSIGMAVGAGYFVMDRFKINTLKGAIGFSIVSSIGSIWANACAFGFMHHHQKDMKDKGFIDNNENKSKISKTWKNHLAYDAYFGKVIGILSCIPVAIFASKKGYLAKEGSDFKRPLLAAFWLSLIGSGETLVTCIVQACRDTSRKSKIDASKDFIVSNPDKDYEYDGRKKKVSDASTMYYQKRFLSNATHAFINYCKNIVTFGHNKTDEAAKLKPQEAK